MNRSKLAALLLFVLVATAGTPRISSAQSYMTVFQYAAAQERAEAFCNYYMEQTKGNKPFPSGKISFQGSRKGIDWVFTAEEAQALVKKCKNLIQLINQTK